MTMLDHLLDRSDFGVAWFADQAPKHAESILAILRDLDCWDGKAPLTAQRLSAQRIINEMADAAGDGPKSDADLDREARARADSRMAGRPIDAGWPR